ncbi:hypothetical protein GRJ2_001840600 [Grus japonensis]|uniref:Uncharacterized protein n=1 Tax=Grus japonensis TaxID=30415 RepID=A0ABC9X7T5_GRUJA
MFWSLVQPEGCDCYPTFLCKRQMERFPEDVQLTSLGILGKVIREAQQDLGLSRLKECRDPTLSHLISSWRPHCHSLLGNNGINGVKSKRKRHRILKRIRLFSYD